MAAVGGGESVKTGPDDRGQEQGPVGARGGWQGGDRQGRCGCCESKLRGDAESTVSAIGCISVLF